MYRGLEKMTTQYAIVFGFGGERFNTRKQAEKRAKKLSEETGYEFEVLEIQEEFRA